MANDLNPITIQILGKVMIDDYIKELFNSLVAFDLRAKQQEEERMKLDERTKQERGFISLKDLEDARPQDRPLSEEYERRFFKTKAYFDQKRVGIHDSVPFFGHASGKAYPPSQGEARDALFAYACTYHIPLNRGVEDLPQWWARVRERMTHPATARPNPSVAPFVQMMDVMVAAVTNTPMADAKDSCPTCSINPKSCVCNCLDCSVAKSAATPPPPRIPNTYGKPSQSVPRPPSIGGTTTTAPAPAPAVAASRILPPDPELTPEQKKLGIRSSRYLRSDNDLD